MWTALIALILQFESFQHVAYKDRTQHTYGFGTKATEKMCITEEWAEKLALDELKKHQKIVNGIKGLNDNQIAALVSLSYNIGEGAFQRSKLYHLANSGQMCQASQEFDRWVFQSGKKLKGLQKRRVAEKKLFSKGLRC